MSAHVPGCTYDHNLKKFTARGPGCAAPDEHDGPAVRPEPVARPRKPKPGGPLHCKFCGRHYPRKRLKQGKAVNWPGSPPIIVCGRCVTERAGVLAKAGIDVPGAKRRLSSFCSDAACCPPKLPLWEPKR